MMQTITLGQLVHAVNGVLLGEYGDLDTSIDVLDTDSRAVHEGAVFWPLVGERFDGHAYIASALNSGAAGTLTDRELDDYRADKFYVKVEDTELALRDLAVWYKSQFPIPFVAVTGSVGKTTAKDMIACVLGQKYKLSMMINLILILSVIGMFFISMTSSNPTILNYEAKLLDKYAAWEQELTEREQEIRAKEDRLGNSAKE